MPRPREKSDTDLLAGTMLVIQRLGPERMTLADVAAEVGMAPATLMQRFGSKRGLLLAVARHRAETVGIEFAGIRNDHDSALATLGAVAAAMTQMVETPESLANSLAFLQMDLADPEFQRHALTHARAMRAEIRSLLDAAIENGELSGCDTRRLARAIHGMLNGSLLTWAVDRDGAVEKRVREDLEMLLAPFRQTRRPAPRKMRR
ncbi:MAG: TetR/AcrR family transcriptional regulator [Acidobacteriota bacterium]